MVVLEVAINKKMYKPNITMNNKDTNKFPFKEVTMEKTIHKEILRAMIISSYKDNIITLKEYTDMIRKLDKR